MNSPESNAARTEKNSAVDSANPKTQSSQKANDPPNQAFRTKGSEKELRQSEKVEVKKEEEVEERKTKKEEASAGTGVKKVDPKPAGKPVKAAFGALAGPSGQEKVYEPGKAKYHPIEDAIWKHGEK